MDNLINEPKRYEELLNIEVECLLNTMRTFAQHTRLYMNRDSINLDRSIEAMVTSQDNYGNEGKESDLNNKSMYLFIQYNYVMGRLIIGDITIWWGTKG